MPKNLRTSNLRFRYQQGFTLVEILIAVAVITIIAAFGIASFNNAARSNTVSQEAKELRVLARKMRTDSRAATKPAGTACNSAATLYGTYLTFDKTANHYYSGVVCFVNATGAHALPEDDPQILPLGLTLSYVYSSNLIVFYSFDGQVRFFNSTQTRPDKTTLDNPSAGITPQPDPAVVTISGSSTSYSVFFSKTGLVCEQKSTASVPCL